MNRAIIDGVDAWLDEHEAWIQKDNDRLALRHTWGIMAGALRSWWGYMSQLPPCDEVVDYSPEGAKAALTGILHALVQEAWGRPVRVEWGRRCEVIGPNYGKPLEWWVWAWARPRLASGPTKSDALLAALLSAPEAP